MPPGKIGSLSGVCRGNKWGVKQYVNHFLDVVNSLTNSGAEKYETPGERLTRTERGPVTGAGDNCYMKLKSTLKLK